MERILIEVAPGELIDKITILEIKSERIRELPKLEHVRHELSELSRAWKTALGPSETRASAELFHAVDHLRSVNRSLWQIEDDLRVCEKDGEFGSRFIELARAVYHQNDRRAAIKRRINQLLDSRLMEEKSYAA